MYMSNKDGEGGKEKVCGSARKRKWKNRGEFYAFVAFSFSLHLPCIQMILGRLSDLDQSFKQPPSRRSLWTINLLIITAYPFLPRAKPIK